MNHCGISSRAQRAGTLDGIGFSCFTVFMNSYIHSAKPRRPNAVESAPPLQAVRLLDQVRERIRYRHYSYRTEQQYVYWVRAFVRFHGVRHPREMGAAEVERFLTWLAAERKVAVSTHKQALSALIFLYRHVLGIDLPWLADFERPRTPVRLPTVLSREGCKNGDRTHFCGLQKPRPFPRTITPLMS